MEVKGTKNDELMTKFRKSILGNTPPQEKKQAELFIEDNAKSVVSLFLIKKYFIAIPQPDYKKALSLLTLLEKEQPKNIQVGKLKQQISAMKDAGIGTKLPTFTSYDTKGKLISSTELTSSPVAVIYTWATFNYDSQDIQRELKKRQTLIARQTQADGLLPGCKQEQLPGEYEARLYQLGCSMQWRNAGRQDFEEVGTHFDARQHHTSKWKNNSPRP